MRADNRTEAKFRVEEDALGNVEAPADHRCMLHRRGQATADQVGPDLRARGRVCPSQSNILETEVTTATRMAEFVFDKGLAQVERPEDVRSWSEGQLYKPQHGA
jgi:hypothetical protein